MYGRSLGLECGEWKKIRRPGIFWRLFSIGDDYDAYEIRMPDGRLLILTANGRLRVDFEDEYTRKVMLDKMMF